MSLFKSSEELQLDKLIQRVEMNMSNNYKDNAQSAYSEYVKLFEEVKASGKLKPKKLAYYEQLLDTYGIKLKGYTHKDQKPYWT